MKLVIILLMLSLVAGQLIRLPLPGQGGGMLVSDIAVVVFLFSALFRVLFRTSRSMSNDEIRMTNSDIRHLCFVISPFVLWSLFTLIIRFTDLGPHNFSISFLYWLRLTSNLLLLPALLTLFRDESLRRFVHSAFLWTVVTLVFAGLIQFFFWPNINIPGWDPHRSRLVSTWLDPNLFGGFLILTVPWLLSTRHKLLTLPATAALILTQSRTSLIALVAVVTLLSPVFVSRIAAFGFLPERFLGILTIDETASLRLASLASAWKLVEQHPWLGVGYNAYQFAAAEAEHNQDFSIHSRAGADNSLLTLWVTTGLPGVLLFFLPWILIARRLPLAANASLLALFIHSQFVNSFLYSHLLVTLIIIITLAWPYTKNS